MRAGKTGSCCLIRFYAHFAPCVRRRASYRGRCLLLVEVDLFVLVPRDSGANLGGSLAQLGLLKGVETFLEQYAYRCRSRGT